MTDQAPSDSREIARHLLLFPDGSGQWALWRSACLRGAGFPVADVLRIASPRSADAADRLRGAEDEAERLRAEALQGVASEIPTADRSSVRALVKAVQKLKKGRPPEGHLPAGAREPVELFAAALERSRAAEAEYLATFAAEEARLSSEIRDTAREDRFREAILWQNRRAFKTGIDSVLRADEGKRTSKDRHNEQVIAFYLQRFCTKNDTIGFFGPVGWASLGDGSEAVSVRHGEGFLAARKVYFEGWSIDALSDALSGDEALRPWLAPRRSLMTRVEKPLSAGQRALLLACDGKASAYDLAVRLVAARAFPDEAAVYAACAELQAAGLVSWGIELPVALEPERPLRRQLEGLTDPAARRAALGKLDALEAARDDVARAAGEPRALDAALGALEERFTQLTGRDSTRAHGEIYAGRTVVYEDCRRGTDAALGADVMAALAPPLSLLLTSARWLTYAAAERHRDLFRTVFELLRRETNASRVPMVAFGRRVLPRMLGAMTSPLLVEIVPRFIQRWQEILPLPEGRRQVHFTSEELRPKVLRAFAAPRPGWSLARYHSPDVMLDAGGCEAIRRGDYRFVLGEIHLGVNSLGTNLFLAQHPSPEELLAAFERDLPAPCVLPLRPKQWRQEEAAARLGFPLQGVSGRMDFGLVSPKELFLEILPVPTDVPRSRVLSVAELMVENTPSGVMAVTRDGRRFDMIEVLQMGLTAQSLNAFKIVEDREHTPRITIDRLIVTRETWRRPAAEMEFARAKTDAERFAGARRWAQGHGMPRFVFVKTPVERKPFFLDLASPVSVEIFTRELRRAQDETQGRASITVSEMLPAPEGAWLPDAEGRLYTSELRIVAVDQAGL